MELRLLSLISYTASAAYLVGWLLRQAWALFLKGRTWWFQRKMAGKVLSLKTRGYAGGRHENLLSLAGALFGCVVILWLSQWLIKEWLLISLVVLALLSEEFQTSKRETQLLSVMALLDRLHAHYKPDEDLFEILAKVVQELPAGEVQKAVREAIYRRRSGIAVEKSMNALRRIDPFLDELILSLRLMGWENGPALKLVLNRLLQHAGRVWDHTSRIMLIKDKARSYVRFGRAAFISGLFVLLLDGSAVLVAPWPGQSIVVWIGLVLVALGFLLLLSLTNQWVRRTLVALILLAALAAGTNTIKVDAPAWIQVQTVTYSSPNLPDPRNILFGTQVSDPMQTTYYQLALPSGTLFNPQTTTLATTPTPSLVSAFSTARPVVMPTLSAKELIESCCHRFHLPR